jgi:hypothetical protein
LVQFFIDGLAFWASASSDAFFNARIWLNFATCETAALATLLVDLSSRAGNGAFGGGCPFVDDHSVDGALAGVRSERCALAGRVRAARADGFLAHMDVRVWVDDRVTALQCAFCDDGADLFGLFVVQAGGASLVLFRCGVADALGGCLPGLGELCDVLDVVSFDRQRVIFGVSVEVTAETSNLSAKFAAELNFECRCWVPDEVDANGC